MSFPNPISGAHPRASQLASGGFVRHPSLSSRPASIAAITGAAQVALSSHPAAQQSASAIVVNELYTREALQKIGYTDKNSPPPAPRRAGPAQPANPNQPPASTRNLSLAFGTGPRLLPPISAREQSARLARSLLAEASQDDVKMSEP